MSSNCLYPTITKMCKLDYGQYILSIYTTAMLVRLRKNPCHHHLLVICSSQKITIEISESIKAKETFATYDHKLRAYMKYMEVGEDQYSQLTEGKDTRIIEADLVGFIISLKKKNYSLASQQLYLSALIHFYNINDIMLNRKKISKFMSNDDNDNNDNYGEAFICNSRIGICCIFWWIHS